MLFSRSNQAVKDANQFVWFRKWILHRQTFTYLSKESGYSIRTLKNQFHKFLLHPPELKLFSSERLNLLIDGTYFSNDICLIVYRDSQIKFTQLYRLSDGEHLSEIKEDLENLLSIGVQIDSITCDGHKAIIKAIRLTCSSVILQRCLVHIQRECRLWLTYKPKSEAGVMLLLIVSKLNKVHTHEQSQLWMKSLLEWHAQYKSFINEKSYNSETNRYWYKHKMVRKAFVHLKNALPHMFSFLFNERVPKSTNGLESFFGHLKSHLLLHRGLTKQHRKDFIKWYLYFRNEKRFS